MVLIATADALNSDQGEKITPTAPASPVLADPLPAPQTSTRTWLPLSDGMDMSVPGSSATDGNGWIDPGFTMGLSSPGDNLTFAKQLLLPDGMANAAELGKFMKWGTGNQAARERAQTVTLEEMNAGNMTVEIAQWWRDFYKNEIIKNPNNPSAEGRAELMERVVELLTGE